MKRSLLFLGTITMAMLFTGCGFKQYVDVKSDDYATLQLVSKSETSLFTDEYYAIISTYEQRCKNSIHAGKILETDSDTPSRIVKIAVEKPIKLNVNYKIESFNSMQIERAQYILIPEKNKHYIVEYIRKDIGSQTLSDYNIYEFDGKNKVRIPDSRIRVFDPEKECH